MEKRKKKNLYTDKTKTVHTCLFVHQCTMGSFKWWCVSGFSMLNVSILRFNLQPSHVASQLEPG
jgi:hypothetical protein